MLEGDNLGVINAIWQGKDGLTSVGVIVADIFRLGCSCNRLAFSFVKREGNVITYVLAKFARSIFDFVV